MGAIAIGVGKLKGGVHAPAFGTQWHAIGGALALGMAMCVERESRHTATQSARLVHALSARAMGGRGAQRHSPGQVISWMLARPETLSLKAQEPLGRIMQMDDILAQARELTQSRKAAV